ncbi:MAG: hypothetical protein L3J54_01060 [Draconibacterium sp.]|nr:hypothetical protein [Draconibacterium sp.]
MNRKITEEETKQLFLFCRKRYVYHYDLQIELVDHLASAIEEQWKTDSELTFNEALKKSFAKFGIYGFSKIKKQKEKELRRKYNRLLWKYFLEFYKLPKVIMTFAFTLGLFLLFQTSIKSSWIILTYFLLILIFIVYYYFNFTRNDYKIKLKPGKSFILINYLKSIQISIIFLAQFPLQSLTFYNLFEKHSYNQWIMFTISFFMVAFSILLYGQFFFIPKKIKEHFMEHFAEFAV